MREVLVNQVEWQLEELLGSGGGGEVYRAVSSGGREAAIKIVSDLNAADRELLVADIPPSDYLMPILESGLVDGKSAIISPIAEGSLEDHLKGKVLNVESAIEIALDIAHGLVALVDAGIVHRDLKPANILKLGEHWRLADFGIARLEDVTTGMPTFKAAGTAPYVAPERWKFARATSASDVYSFGVILFELVTAKRPFSGPDYRVQHLTEPPPELPLGSTALKVLTELCLGKQPAARPTAARVITALQRARDENSSKGVGALAKVNLNIERERSKSDAERAFREEATQVRRELYEACCSQFRHIADPLLAAIVDTATAASVHYGQEGTRERFTISFGSGRMGVTNPLPVERLPGRVDIVAHAAITVRRTDNGAGRSHCLWYCDAEIEGEFHWYETAFMAHPSVIVMRIGDREDVVPYSLDPADSIERERIISALAQQVGLDAIARPFLVADLSDPSEFIDRWITVLAQCADQTYVTATVPEGDPVGTWRK